MQKNHAKRTALALFLLFAVTVSAQAAKIAEVIPIGHTVGIKMQAECVLIVQLTEVQGADGTHSPAKEAGVQEGDVLCRAGETALHSNDDLQKQVALSAGQPIKLTLERGDAEKSVTVTPCRDKTGAYRIGVLARDSLAGIGTLTYVDPQTGAFGSLGHGICDSETGVLLPLQEGTIIHSTVSSVQRGKAGLDVGARAHFGRGTEQHPHLSFPHLCKKLRFLNLCLCIVNKGDFLWRYALGHQLLLHIVVDVEGTIPLWGRQVAEYKLRPLDFLRIPPYLQHIPDAGVDLAFRIVRQRRVRQPLIQSKFTSIRGDF